MSILRDIEGFTGIPQKVALVLAGAVALTMGGIAGGEWWENRTLTAANVKLDTAINDPKTGYVVRLTQAEGNTATCTAAIGRQNTAIKAQSARDAATVAAVQARYDSEHVARVTAENAAAAFMAVKPKGATLVDRVSDVDRRIVGELK